MHPARLARVCRLCRWGLLAVICGQAAHGRGADNAATARATLTAKGLTFSSGLWLNRRELELRRRIEGLDALVKRASLAHQQADAMLQNNELLRAELRRLEAVEKATGKAPPPPSGNASAGTSEAKRPEERLNSQLPDVTGRGDETPLQAAIIDWVNARTALELLLLDVDRSGQALEREYRTLAADTDVAQALATAGARLGPARDYRKLPRLIQAARDVFTSTVPIYRQSGRWRVCAVVDEQTPATFTYVEQSQPSFVSATLAQSLALEATPDAPQPQRVGNRQISVRRGRLPTLRLGKFLFRDVQVWLLPPEAEDLGSQLASGALAGCRLRLVPNQMALELESLASAQPPAVDRLRDPRGLVLPHVAQNWKTRTVILRSQ